jgi:Helix-turn-helix domain
MSNEMFAPLPLEILRRTDLPAGAKLIYARLKLYTGTNDEAYPSVTTLAAECGIDRLRVMRNIKKLEAAGLVTVKRSYGYGNRYHLTSIKTDTSIQNDTRIKTDTTPVSKQLLPPVSKQTPLLVSKQLHRKEVLKRGIEKKSEKNNAVIVPAVLSTPLFLEAWKKFQQHRTELRKPLTPTASGALLKRLTGWGVERSVAAIDHSIASGWQSIYEQNTAGANRTGQRNQPPTEQNHANGF